MAVGSGDQHVGFYTALDYRLMRDAAQEIDELRHLVGELQAAPDRDLLAEVVRERENYNGMHQAAVMEVDRLRAVLEQIADMDPLSARADDLGRAARIAREALGDAETAGHAQQQRQSAKDAPEK
jgi:Sec-independent protein translocase protein TatA